MKTKVTGRFVIGLCRWRPRDLSRWRGCLRGRLDHLCRPRLSRRGGRARSRPGRRSSAPASSISTRSPISTTPSSIPGSTPDRLLGQRWSEDYFHGERREIFSSRRRRSSGATRSTQLILNGITTAMPIAAETYKALGARPTTSSPTSPRSRASWACGCTWGRAIAAGVNVMRADGTSAVLWDEARGEAGLEEAVALHPRLRRAARRPGRGALLPCADRDDHARRAAPHQAYSDEFGCPVRLHAAQGSQEVRFLREWYGKRPIELLHELGFLGPRTLIPHVTTLGVGVTGRTRVGDLQVAARFGHDRSSTAR